MKIKGKGLMQIIFNRFGLYHLCLVNGSFGTTIIGVLTLTALRKKTAEYRYTITL